MIDYSALRCQRIASVSRWSALLLVLVAIVALGGCGQDAQASEGDDWRWLAASADDSQTFVRYLGNQDDLSDFWHAAELSTIPIDAAQPLIDFDREFVLVLSTRGRGTEPKPCGVYFRGLRADREAQTVTIIFEPDTSAEACDASYRPGQYVIAVDREFTGPPPFDLLIDEPGQAGQPDPVRVSD